MTTQTKTNNLNWIWAGESQLDESTEQNRLRKELIMYHLIAQASGDVFFEWRPGTGELHWHADIGAQLLGYDEGELCLKVASLESLIYVDDQERFALALEKLKATEQIDLELRLTRKDGKPTWVHLVALPVSPSRDGMGITVGAVRNTQELHETQDQLSEERRIKTLGTMAGGIAHEFNNHLTPIRGFIELTMNCMEPEDPLFEGLQTALNRVQYCADLVAQIQAYGRKAMIQPENLDLNRFLPSMIHLALSIDQESASKVSLEQEIVKKLPNIHVDRSQFQQAISHLVRNALEAMRKGGTLSIKVDEVHKPMSQARGTGSDSGVSRFVRIRIIDTGEGIKPEEIGRIFDPFYTTRGRAVARGMGLPMVQGVVEQHGGWLDISSEPSKGTEVVLFFPVSTTPEKSKANLGDDDALNVVPAAPVGHLLLADDEKHIRKLICRVFENDGWDVDEAENNFDVQHFLNEGIADYSLLILDIVLPGPPIETILKLVREKLPTARVLVVSGYDIDERISKLQREYGVAFIGKPFSPKDLLARADEILVGHS